MAEHGDHHDDHPVHQAPWVMWLTVGVCVFITAAILALKMVV